MWKQVKNRIILIIGFIVLGIGIIGILVPVLPTTPFVLLAAWLFARSSSKYHRWLRSNRYFGNTIRSWESGEGLSIGTKWRIIILSILFIGISFAFCPNIAGRIVLVMALPIPICVAIFSKTKR